MSRNESLARTLQEMALLLDLTGADSFKASAHARAARTIEALGEPIETVVRDREALLAMEGVGAKMADKIEEFCKTGRIAEHAGLLREVPPGVLELTAIPGLGPKTIRTMWREGGIESVADLKKAIESGAILGLPRMGAKTVENIKKAIEFGAKSAGRTRLGQAIPLAEATVERLRKVKGVKAAAYAGSLRRGRETVGDIDIVVAATGDVAATATGEAFRTMPEVREVLAAGDTKSSVRADLQVTKDVEGTGRTNGGLIQMDLRVVPPASYGAALLYFTGSKEHNVRLRGRALSMGMTLNEYGLFPEDKKEKSPPHERGVKPVAGATEEDIYAALGLPWVPPELREDRGECDAPKGHDWELLELKDVKAELHAHTTASDGRLSIVALAEAAKARGFHTIAVTDHSRSQPIAGGLTPERLLAHIDAVHAARAKVKGIHILAGSEVDILPDGRLDYDDDLLTRLDIVVASPHAALKQGADDATARLVRAASHPLVHIIGHPTGRYINSREGLAPDMRAVAKAAAKHKTALEINANFLRLDLRDAHVRIALEEGANIAIDCDVHGEADFDQLRFGVVTGRRAGLTPERCVNCWSATRLHAWLTSKR